MSFFATCAGFQIVSGSLVIPLVGAWTADLSLASEDGVSGKVEVVIGNLTLQGTVYRTAVYGGQTRARIVGGAGGWRASCTPQGYGTSSGVKLSTVLSDLASAVGETINITADTNIGNAFARVSFPTSVASDVLWQMIQLGFMRGWYVDQRGITQTSPWPPSQVSTPFTPTDQNPDAGIIEIATEDYAAWMPGCVFSHPLLAGSYVSAGVIYTWGEKFRLQVLTQSATDTDRVLGPIQQIVRTEVAPTRFFGRYEYTISNPTSTTIDGAPVDTLLGLPELQNVPLSGTSLATYVPPDGGKAHVMFLDGSPTKPVCVWTEVTGANGPTEIVIAPQGSGQNNVARVTDTVVVMFPPLMQIAGVIGAAPFVGVLTITTPAIGAIQTGSSVVKAAQSS